MSISIKNNNKRSGPEAVWPGLEAGVPKPVMPYSPAIKAGGWVFIAGQLASDFKTGLAPSIVQTNPNIQSRLASEAEFVLQNLQDTVKATGCDMNRDMVRISEWFVSDKPTKEQFQQGNNLPEISIAPYISVRQENVPDCPPATSLGVSELMWRGTTLEIDLICFDDDNESITFADPKYPEQKNAALRRGDWVFLSAQNVAKPNAGSSDWLECPVTRQTRAVLDKLSAVAKIAGSSLEQTVKAEVFLGRPEDFAAMDQVWREYFPANPPARVVVPYMGMGEPGCRVEVALTMLADDASIQKQTINTSKAPQQPGHEPQAVKAGNFLFYSTQMAFDSSGNLAEGMVRHPNSPWYGSPGKNQMRYMMENIGAIAKEAGTTVENIVRRVCFHSDLQWFSESIEEWAKYFPGDKPASTTIGLRGPFVVEGANTLLDLIAFVPE